MNDHKDKFVNGQRIALGLILFILCVACFVQTSMMGCSGNGGSGDESETGSRSSHTPFFSRSGEDATPPDGWEPVSDKVMGQIMSMYEDSGIGIECLEKSEIGAPAIRCLLDDRDGVPVEKQLLDGLHIMASTFPNLQQYIVQINGDEEFRTEIDWNTLMTLEQNGYTLESGSADAESLWQTMMQDQEHEEVLPDDSAETVQVENSGS